MRVPRISVPVTVTMSIFCGCSSCASTGAADKSAAQAAAMAQKRPGVRDAEGFSRVSSSGVCRGRGMGPGFGVAALAVLQVRGDVRAHAGDDAAQLLGGRWAEVVIGLDEQRPCRIARELGGQQLGGQQRVAAHGAAPGVHQLGAAHEGIAGGHLALAGAGQKGL